MRLWIHESDTTDPPVDWGEEDSSNQLGVDSQDPAQVSQLLGPSENQKRNEVGSVAELPTNRYRAWQRFRRHRLAVLGLAIFTLLALAAIFAPFVSRYPPNQVNLRDSEQPPSAAHWLGTDTSGRDVWSRIIHGTRISLSVGIVSALLVTVIGTTLGGIAGYSGGVVDSVISRVTDVFMAFPTLVVIVVLVTLVGPSVVNIMLVIGFFWWPGLCRVARAQFLSLRERDFVLAAHCVGVPHHRILLRHVLPNAIGPIIVETTFVVAFAILMEASLSFLGLGVQIPTPSWGSMLFSAKSFRILQSLPWLWIAPGIMIMITALSVNFVGDAMRDALDPRAIT